MSISNISPATSLPGIQAGSRAEHQEFQALQNDLKAGNISAAQQDFAAIQQAMEKIAGTMPGSQPLNPTGRAGKDFQALQSALESGSVSSASQALATLQQSLTTPNQAKAGNTTAQTSHHPHQHHHGGGGTQSITNPASASPAVQGLMGA
jgi:hypothetical protein